MLWRYVEKKVKNSLYPNLSYWSPILPYAIRKSIYKKHGLNIKFEFIPEWWSPYDFFFFLVNLKATIIPRMTILNFFFLLYLKKMVFFLYF
jgi:hypothetical protein